MSGYEGIAAEDAYAFRLQKIDSLRALGPAHTLMTLTDKKEIIITLPQAELMQRLNTAEEAVIDLKDKTMVTGRDALIKQLQADAKRKAEMEKEKEITSLRIKAFIRASQKSEFLPFTFNGADIVLSKIEEGGSIHGGKNIRMKLHKPAETPFGEREFIIEGKLEEFRRLCREAYQSGADQIDMSEFSMRKFKDNPPKKMRQLHDESRQP